MDLRDYLRTVRKQWALILAVLVVVVGAGLFLTYRATPLYSSKVTFFVTTPAGADAGTNYQGGLFSQQRTKSYADLLNGDTVDPSTAQGLTPPLSSRGLAGKLTATLVPDTVLLQVTAIDPSPKRAQQIAQAVGRGFPGMVQKLETGPGATNAAVKVDVVGEPLLPSAPFAPRPSHNLALAVILGLLVGVGLAVLREALDTTVKTADALAKISKAAVLANIPYDSEAKKAPLIVQQRGVHSARAEAFRHLRTNLQFVDVDHPPRSIVVTSPLPSDGKSTSAANLAITLAQAGTKTILVEGDLRRPKVVDYLGLEGSVGLTDVLVGRATLDDVVQTWGNEHLDVLASGAIPPNPSELLGSRHMTQVLNDLEARYEAVVIDAPPLLPVADGAVLAARADGALLVVRFGKTTTAHAEKAIQSLRAVDARLLGTVLNMVPLKGAEGEAYDYSYDDMPGGRPQLTEPVVDGTPTAVTADLNGEAKRRVAG